MALLNVHSFRRVLSNIYGSPRCNLALIEREPAGERAGWNPSLILLCSSYLVMLSDSAGD